VGLGAQPGEVSFGDVESKLGVALQALELLAGLGDLLERHALDLRGSAFAGLADAAVHVFHGIVGSQNAAGLDVEDALHEVARHLPVTADLDGRWRRSGYSWRGLRREVECGEFPGLQGLQRLAQERG
jgi:hypothetical protein